MASFRTRRLALALAGALVATAVAVPAVVAADPTGVSCDYNESTGQLSATFTVDPGDVYGWAWRRGSRALAGGYGELSAGTHTKTATTRRNLSGEVRFGVIRRSDPNDYAYVICS